MLFSHSVYTSASALPHPTSMPSSGPLESLHHNHLPLPSPRPAPPSPASHLHPTGSLHRLPFSCSSPQAPSPVFLSPPSLPHLRLLPPTQLLCHSSAPPFDVCREASAGGRRMVLSFLLLLSLPAPTLTNHPSSPYNMPSCLQTSSRSCLERQLY